MIPIKKIYLYLVSLISLVIAIIGAIMLINFALNSWLFKSEYDYSYQSIPRAIAMIVVAVPVFYIHWRLVNKQE